MKITPPRSFAASVVRETGQKQKGSVGSSLECAGQSPFQDPFSAHVPLWGLEG